MTQAFLPPARERGAALLTVLLLVAVMGALTALALERMRLATALAVNSAAMDRARFYATGLEALATLTLNDMRGAGGDAGSLVYAARNQERRIPLPGGGSARLRMRDGGNCFNLNSLAAAPADDAPRSSNPKAILQFAQLMRVLEIPKGQAVRIAAAAADWADSDINPNAYGAEDADYGQAKHPYRAANAPFAEVSELRAVAGVSPDLYARLRPYLCALPDQSPSPININTLLPDQAPLLSMLAPERIPNDRARGALAARPQQGWDNLYDLWTLLDPRDDRIPEETRSQLQLKTGWFALDVRIDLAQAALVETALIDARDASVRVVARHWGEDE